MALTTDHYFEQLSFRVFQGVLARLNAEGTPITKEVFLKALRESIHTVGDMVEIAAAKGKGHADGLHD